MEQIYQEVLKGFQQMTLLEGIAVLFGVISVLCSRQNSVWVYPTGLVSTGIYTYMLAQVHFKLYAEAALNAYYFIMSVYGWYYWSRNTKSAGDHVGISAVNRRELGTAVAIVVIGWSIIYFLLRRFSDSDVPILDAFVSATACSGMWLLAKRKIENWIFLNISNFVAVPLLFYKHLALTALLTIFLFIVAVNGYFHWRKLYRQQLNENNP
ncbi:nicotinamide riboside transporter PnuC [Chitinophaga barathri]|uniref:Nicotinamide riboside transporter PnuC n=1 Tax=Chitinophaga barathri TaxID=1647451 RepID=A0A3N4M8W7_9BACT|nr:nicotinamide riboside transporter PnuC [Chitinophaga barathri]RPD38006.1 nicotinamide riboside transporter PnuC [Chitinophaga barathri]